MRLHRHQVGRTNRWHSVRVRHREAWDWCAHREEVAGRLALRQRATQAAKPPGRLELQPAR